MKLTIQSNTPLNAAVYRLCLRGELPPHRPGQFVQVAVPGFYLRRPISVFDAEGDSLTLVYRVTGEGTARLAQCAAGETLSVLCGLGNGYDLEKAGEKPLLVGGGIGLPPLYLLCRRLKEAGRFPVVAAGFSGAGDVILRQDFETLGVPFHVATLDGSCGKKGLVTALLPELDFDSLCACGPVPMMQALWRETAVPAQFSLEERMGCGFGACMGCTLVTTAGPKRVCKEGPVFGREELKW